MSDQAPTAEELRDARRAGFNDSVAHMDDDRRERLTESYHKQDDRRSANVTEFRNDILSSNED